MSTRRPDSPHQSIAVTAGRKSRRFGPGQVPGDWGVFVHQEASFLIRYGGRPEYKLLRRMLEHDLPANQEGKNTVSKPILKVVAHREMGESTKKGLPAELSW